jgi:beta-lactamase regulating signal transducer with metallopeptidase domain
VNDLGLTLSWLAVQQALVLVPALVLNALASRRGPASAAQVAVLSLGLVVALNVAALLPHTGWNDRSPEPETPRAVTVTETDKPASRTPWSGSIEVMKPGITLSRTFKRLVLAWDRLGRGATEPAVRIQPRWNILAAVLLVGTAAGLLQLVIGLWAVAVCCRRGRSVDDPAMTNLLGELHAAMGCARSVRLREVPDLTTPATAGRRRPVVLLPDDWRSWSPAERRAVLAHDLAHVVRGDYAATLLARLAVVLNYFHPLVRWMAGRLQLQQEQAAEAMAARFAGGPARYLVALSSLALRQDGRSPC